MYDDDFNGTELYVTLAVIPAGSRHILIDKRNQSMNFLSIGKANSNDSYLNGNSLVLKLFNIIQSNHEINTFYRLIYSSGEYIIADSTGLYVRENETEKLLILNPIQQDISVKVCLYCF